MINSLKNLIPFEIKASILLFFYQFKSLKSFGFKPLRQTNKRVFIFLAADYGNLGDVAITYAQHKFIQQNFPGYLVTEIPISATIKGIAYVKKKVKDQDVVTTVGGGNMGDLYPMIEHFRQMVITNFKNNMVISFPQTIDFNKTPSGKKALANAIKIYSNHNNLILLAREQKTYDFFVNNFKKNKAILVPDIVLSLDKTKPEKERKGAIICLRDDKEKNLNQDEENALLRIIDENFDKKCFRDTHIGGDHLPLFNRVKALNSIWNDFKGAEMVITDRLHGMIFCYITNTPAIVFLNNNHKIKSSFKWINTSKHIHLMENFSEEDITASIKFLKQEENRGQKDNLSAKYSAIVELINKKK